jgi:hypothetical protein
MNRFKIVIGLLVLMSFFGCDASKNEAKTTTKTHGSPRKKQTKS